MADEFAREANMTPAQMVKETPLIKKGDNVPEIGSSPQFESAIEAQVAEFLQPSFGDCTALLIASALVGAAMNWRHQASKLKSDPIVSNIVGILVDGVEKQRT